jgi:hypothetical protein
MERLLRCKSSFGWAAFQNGFISFGGKPGSHGDCDRRDPKRRCFSNADCFAGCAAHFQGSRNDRRLTRNVNKGKTRFNL